MSEPDPTAGGSELERMTAAELAALEERIAHPQNLRDEMIAKAVQEFARRLVLEERREGRQMTATVACPFCGVLPYCFPVDPMKEPSAWALVECLNRDCPARPSVQDGLLGTAPAGSLAYLEDAIQRWNHRPPPGGKPMGR